MLVDSNHRHLFNYMLVDRATLIGIAKDIFL